ncbi:colicin E3/pyocin S6 family cytotoxin [Amycolatopsis sp. TRM77291]
MHRGRRPDKNLPGFPDAEYVGKGSPKSGRGYRARWSMPDGRVLEWDSAPGAIEMWVNGKTTLSIWVSLIPIRVVGYQGKPVPGRKPGADGQMGAGEI